MNVRLQKYLSEAGVASRRASEKIITDGRVTVNGVVVNKLGAKVNAVADKIAVDGQLVRVKRKVYLAINKPVGYICTRKDELSRKTIGDLLPREWTNLYPVGRLDADSEGLIFLTNDGDFSLHLTHPRFGISKKYIAAVTGRVEPHIVRRFTEGIIHDGETLKAQRAKVISANNSNSMVELELTEGKNREVRRLFESQGMEVNRLVRVQIGKIKLAELPVGKWRTLTEAEIKSLLSA